MQEVSCRKKRSVSSFLLRWTFLVCCWNISFLSFFGLLCRKEVKEDHPGGWKFWDKSPCTNWSHPNKFGVSSSRRRSTPIARSLCQGWHYTTKARSFLSGSFVFFPNHKLPRKNQLRAVQWWYFSIQYQNTCCVWWMRQWSQLNVWCESERGDLTPDHIFKSRCTWVNFFPPELYL